MKRLSLSIISVPERKACMRILVGMSLYHKDQLTTWGWEVKMGMVLRHWY